MGLSNLGFGQRIFFTIKSDGSSVIHSSSDLRQHLDKTIDGIRMLMSDSIIIVEATMRKGRLNGTYKSFYDNGIMQEMGQYSVNLKVGKWYYWKEDGNLDRVEIYENGNLVKDAN
jgi:antitoxin component YwqK of YwqJK toxin-antitoxin module